MLRRERRNRTSQTGQGSQVGCQRLCRRQDRGDALMSATIYYLKPFERERLEVTEEELRAEHFSPSPCPAQKTSGKKRYVRNPLPCGRNSAWKRRLNGQVVRRRQ